MSDELVIPDDLKIMYMACQMTTGSTLAPVTKDGAKSLIKRIARLEQQLAKEKDNSKYYAELHLKQYELMEQQLANAREEALEEPISELNKLCGLPCEWNCWHQRAMDTIRALIAKETQL